MILNIAQYFKENIVAGIFLFIVLNACIYYVRCKLNENGYNTIEAYFIIVQTILMVTIVVGIALTVAQNN